MIHHRRLIVSFRILSLFILLTFTSAPPQLSAAPADSPAIRSLRESIRQSPHSLPLRTSLIDAYLKLKSVEGRRAAAEAYADALKRHPDDLDLLIGYGELRMEQGFIQQSDRLFRTAIRLDPYSVGAHFGIARLAIHDYRRYLDEKRLRTCNAALDRVLTLDPGHRDALFFRTFTHLAVQETTMARARVEKLVNLHPEDPWGHLLLGSVAQGGRRFGEARKALETAARLIRDPEEQEAFATLRHLSYRTTETLEETTEPAARERLVRDFWKRSDPTPATGMNERRLEHLRRIVLAELFYAVPGKRIRGWDTAPGEAIVRFGPPKSRSLGIGEMSGAGFQPPAMNHVHEIDGEDVPMTFLDRNLSGLWLQPFNSGRPTTMDVAMHHNESFYPFATGPEVDYLVQTVQFRERPGVTRLELVFATRDSGAVPGRFQRDVTLYDRSWDSLSCATGRLDPEVRARDRRNPSLDYAVDLVAFPVDNARDTVWVGSQIADTLTRGFGGRMEGVPVRSFSGGGVLLSDLLLMDRIAFEPASGLLGRSGGWGVPSPDRVYLSGENVPIYFEAYNLAPGEDGLSRYRVHITIEKATPAHPRMSRPALFDFKTPPRPSVESRFEEGAEPGDVNRMLDLAVGHLASGSYRLTLGVEDLVAGGRATSSARFKIVDPPKPRGKKK